MNQQNLIPITQRSTEEFRELSRKGGLSRSPLKSIAAILRRGKEKGYFTEKQKIKLSQLNYNLDYNKSNTNLKSALKQKDKRNKTSVIRINARKILNNIKQCEICKYNKIPQILIVHHKNGLFNNPENLIKLCPTCHSEIHYKNKKTTVGEVRENVDKPNT